MVDPLAKKQNLFTEMQKVIQGWSQKASLASVDSHALRKQRQGDLVVFGGQKITAKLRQGLGLEIPDWQWKEVEAQNKPIMSLSTAQGPLWLVSPHLKSVELPSMEVAKTVQGGHGGRLHPSLYSEARDSTGTAMGMILSSPLESLNVNFYECQESTCLGGLVALDVAQYQFRRLQKGLENSLHIVVKMEGQSPDPVLVGQAERMSASVNLARHLTNLPPNQLYPDSYAQLLCELFSGVGLGFTEGLSSQVQVNVWDEHRLKKENCGLILAVGQGSAFPPRLVHIAYRPQGDHDRQRSQCASLAFVGKGITFDSGGLDLKSSSNMRWMKKDMGGSAALVGLAWWVVQSQYPVACDFYLALAENSVGASSFRPGDILTSRSGTTVEIHNTDAEGRLVMADTLSLAVESQPRFVVDVATLTGAIKTGLGSGIGGVFGNDDERVQQLVSAGQRMGDWLWPMPLCRSYKGALKSQVADLVNSSDGFGGAITAALFLEHFVGSTPWLHLDIYAWKDGAEGALTEAGASGQAVQALIGFLQQEL